MAIEELTGIIEELRSGGVVPYLGPGVLSDVRDKETGETIPADSDSLILAMNNGRMMSQRLMYEFPRAAMHVEQRRGRVYIDHFLTHTYGKRQWTRSAVHEWIAKLLPEYVVDVNRDTQLLDSYAGTPHILVLGTARIMGSEYRYNLYQYDGESYRPVGPDEANWSGPILFKPMGAPLPEPQYIASDADYVDYITELMGGFAIPEFMKGYRKGLKYLFLGMRFTRDTERMVMSDIIQGADMPSGWALIPEPTDKERRFCARQGIEILEVDTDALLAADAQPQSGKAAASASAGL